MSERLRYLVIGTLTLATVAMMAWAAAKPGEGIGSRIYARTAQAISDIAGLFRKLPVEGLPEWSEASLVVHGGDPDRGAAALILYGCGGCHVIPGVTGAQGTVGPRLDGFARRAYIGGVLPNRPGDLVRWLIDPPRHAPETVMPALGVNEQDARDMAAYLYTLKGGRG